MADPNIWVPADEIQKNVINRYLYPIEASVQKLMGRNLALSKIVMAVPGGVKTQ